MLRQSALINLTMTVCFLTGLLVQTYCKAETAKPASGAAVPSPASSPPASPPVANPNTSSPNGQTVATDKKVPAGPTITIVNDKNETQTVTTTRWLFANVDKTAKALIAQALVKTTKKVAALSAPGYEFKKEDVAGDKVRIVLPTMHLDLKVKFEDGSTENWKVDMKLEKSEVILKGCLEAGLRIVVKDKPLSPVFFGAECSVKEDRILLNASVPTELEWDVTTIFETEGKGERWKIFEISRNNLVVGGDVVATFGFTSQGKKSSFALVQSRSKSNAQSDDSKKTKQRLIVGIAAAQVATKATAAVSATGPAMDISYLSDILPFSTRFMFNGFFVLPMSKATAYHLRGGLGWVLGANSKEKSGYGLFVDYAAIGQSQDVGSKSITLQHNQVGTSLLWLLALKSSTLSTILHYNGIGGPSKSMGLRLSWDEVLGGSSQWGVFVDYASQTATGTSTTSTFAQTLLGVDYRM